MVTLLWLSGSFRMTTKRASHKRSSHHTSVNKIAAALKSAHLSRAVPLRASSTTSKAAESRRDNRHLVCNTRGKV